MPSFLNDFKSLVIREKKPSKFDIFKKTDYCFNRACQQVKALNIRYAETSTRYRKALTTGMMNEAYHLYVKITIIEGVRTAYHQYTIQKALELANLRLELFGEEVDIVEESDDIY